MKKFLLTTMIVMLAKLSFACTSSFTYSAAAYYGSLLQYYVSNTSTWGTIPSGDLKKAGVNWGDGSGNMDMYSTYMYHTFPSTGTYTVKLWITVYDSSSSSVYCTDTSSQSITVSYPACGDTVAVAYGTGGAVTFTANCPAGTTSSFTYGWDFGDGSIWGNTNPVTHTYAYNGIYYVTLYDTTGGCTYVDTATIYVTSGSWDCSKDTARFYYGSTGLAYTFMSTTVAPAPLVTNFFWNFGDGGTASGSGYETHTYSSAGSYTVRLVTQWYDTSSSSVVCSDTLSQTITAAILAHKITGYIHKDTLYSPDTANYKVWLITYDSVSHLITGVDSTLDTGTNNTYYEFNNPATNNYLIKAAITNGPTSGSGYVPTYLTSSTDWSTAGRAYYNTSYGTLSGEDIYMQHGTVTSGPGFIAGDVRYGAGKGTAVGDPVVGLLIMVRGPGGNLIKSTLTDASGHYSFGSLPIGTYTIFPEAMGYNTTAWTSINITATTTTVNNIDFKKNSTSIKPAPLGITNVNPTQSFAVYPNPTNGIVTIQWDNSVPGNADLNVTNVTGQNVYNAKLNLDASGRTTIDLSRLQAGVYFMNIMSDNSNFNQKIVIEK